jgi:hypothetical protein
LRLADHVPHVADVTNHLIAPGALQLHGEPHRVVPHHSRPHRGGISASARRHTYMAVTLRQSLAKHSRLMQREHIYVCN